MPQKIILEIFLILSYKNVSHNPLLLDQGDIQKNNIISSFTFSQGAKSNLADNCKKSFPGSFPVFKKFFVKFKFYDG